VCEVVEWIHLAQDRD